MLEDKLALKDVVVILLNEYLIDLELNTSLDYLEQDYDD